MQNNIENSAATTAIQNDGAEQQRIKQFNKNKWLFSLGGIGRDMSYQLVAAFLLVYVQFGVSLSLVQFTTLSLIIGIGGSLWDALNDPIMGAIIEGSHFKWGKFKPWILLGAILCGIVILGMFNVRIWTGWNFVIFIIVMYFLWESTFTMNDIGYWAMLPSLSSKKNERNTVTTLTVIFASVGAFAGQGLVIFLTPGNVVRGYSLVSIIIAMAFIGCQMMTSFGVKETPRRASEKQSKISLKHMWQTIKGNDQILWMTLSMFLYSLGSGLLVALAYNLYYIEVGYDSYSFYFIVIFGVCSVLANLLYPRLAKKLGRKKLQMFSAMTLIFGYAGIALLGWWPQVLPFNLITLSIFGIFVFTGQTLYYLASIINMTNCVEYNEYKQGERNEAVVSTLRPFMTKFASAVQFGVVTLVLAASGIFILSQNISLMESQKNYLSNIDSAPAQVEYIKNIKNYLDIYESAPDEATAKQLVGQAIAEDTDMLKYQINPEYVFSLADCKIFRQNVINGKAAAEKVDLGYWKDIDSADLLTGTGDTSYLYSMELMGEGFNAANENFRNERTVGMRLWIRFAVTAVPIALLALSWLIQRKKFIIDEDYYDMMMSKIKERHGEEVENS
jgi:melibiose permease/lactose/raffinose/galactose permease